MNICLTTESVMPFPQIICSKVICHSEEFFKSSLFAENKTSVHHTTFNIAMIGPSTAVTLTQLELAQLQQKSGDRVEFTG